MNYVSRLLLAIAAHIVIPAHPHSDLPVILNNVKALLSRRRSYRNQPSTWPRPSDIIRKQRQIRRRQYVLSRRRTHRVARRERLRRNRATPRIPAGPGDAIDLRRAVEALETAVVGGVTGAGECHGSGESQGAE